jgi:hypothetical protein
MEMFQFKRLSIEYKVGLYLNSFDQSFVPIIYYNMQ